MLTFNLTMFVSFELPFRGNEGPLYPFFDDPKLRLQKNMESVSVSLMNRNDPQMILVSLGKLGLIYRGPSN